MRFLRLGFILACLLSIASLALAAPALAAPEVPTLTVEPLAHSTEVALKGVLNPGMPPEPPGTYEVGEYQFLYDVGASCIGGGAVPAAPGMSLGEGHEVLPVETLTGLTVGAKYTVCLSFTVAGEPALSAPVTFTAGAPFIESESAPLIGFRNTDVAAKINPNSEATTYTFEYATEATGEALEGAIVKVPGGSIPAGSTAQSAGPVNLGDVLASGTQYFYRVVATNAAGTTDGHVETFTTLTPPALHSGAYAPGWTIESFAAPSSFTTEENEVCLAKLTSESPPPCDEYEVKARNAGAKPMSAGVVLKDTVPAGLTVRGAQLQEIPQFGGSELGGGCAITPGASGTTVVECPYSARSRRTKNS